MTVSQKKGKEGRKLPTMSSLAGPTATDHRDPYGGHGGPSPLVSTPNFILSPLPLGVGWDEDFRNLLPLQDTFKE